MDLWFEICVVVFLASIAIDLGDINYRALRKRREVKRQEEKQQHRVL